MEHLNPIETYKKILNNELKTFPMNFWNKKENIINCTKYMFENILKWNDDDIKKNLRRETFGKYKLAGLLVGKYNNRIYTLINDVYPNKFKPWELVKLSKSYWNEETIIEATKWLIEDKLHWNDNDIKEKLTAQVFRDNGLSHIITLLSSTGAIMLAYPNKFKPWELNTPKSYWNKETSNNAIKWLIEEKLKWNDEDIKNKLIAQTFKNNGLIKVLERIYNYSPYKAINSVYPDRFKPWEFKNVPRNYWSKENARKAIKWLIEEKLHWNDNDIKEKLTAQIFIDNGLRCMLHLVYKGSPYDAINDVYSNKFKKSDLKGYNYNIHINKLRED